MSSVGKKADPKKMGKSTVQKKIRVGQRQGNVQNEGEKGSFYLPSEVLRVKPYMERNKFQMPGTQCPIFYYHQPL